MRIHFAQRPIGVAFGEVDCLTAPGTVRRPDVSVFLLDRPAGVDRKKIPLPCAPDIAVEVISPSESAVDVHAKTLEYLAAGSLEVWQFDHENGEVFIQTPTGIRLLRVADTLDTHAARLLGCRFGSACRFLISSLIPPHGDYRDVVILAPGLGRLRDLCRGLRRDLPRSVETEEFALGVLCFHDAVGDQRQLTSWSQGGRTLLIAGRGHCIGILHRRLRHELIVNPARPDAFLQRCPCHFVRTLPEAGIGDRSLDHLPPVAWIGR